VADAIAMGKAKAGQAAGDRPGSAAHQESPLPLCGFTATIGKALSAKCVAALFLGVGVFLSALFLLLHLRAPGSVPDDPGTLIGKTEQLLQHNISAIICYISYPAI
jgi:hypothetical protein